MNKKNLIKWSFWPLLITILLVGYFIVSKEVKNKHLDFIPSNAKAVVILDSKKLANDYYQLLKNNPTKIDEVMPEGEGDAEWELPTELPGIVPLEKTTFYLYQDKKTKDQSYFLCFIATLSDNAQFLKKMNGMREKAIVKEMGKGKIHFFKEDNKIVLVKNNIGVVIEPLNPGIKLNMNIGERHYNSVFSEKATSLKENNANFSATIKENKHVNIWYSNGEGILEGFGGNMIGIDKIFNSQSISIDLKDKNIETDVHLFLNDKDFILERENDIIPLNENEMLRLSMSLNPEKFHDFFHSILPPDKYFLADGWTGQISTSIIGFRNEPVYKLVPDTIVNSETLDTVFVADTVELSRLVNLPHFVLAIELNNTMELTELIKNDSTIFNIDGQLYINIPHLVNEKIYIKINKNSLLLSSTPLEFDYKPVYSTFYFSMNIEALLNNYPPKDMIQAVIIPSITEFELKSFEMYFDSMTDEYICLHGQLKMGDDKIHSLLKVIPFVFNTIENF